MKKTIIISIIILVIGFSSFIYSELKYNKIKEIYESKQKLMKNEDELNKKIENEIITLEEEINNLKEEKKELIKEVELWEKTLEKLN